MVVPAGSPAEGRLLAYFPDENTSDGGAELASGGFFDVHNTPAWDTWVALFEDASGRGPYLVAWVPPEWIDQVQAGIDVNPERCIEWLKDTDVTLACTLRGGGAS